MSDGMRDLTPRLRAVLYAFAALALASGFLLFVGASRTEDYFSWTIEPPLTAATLGAFYWAAFVLILGAAGQHWAPARPVAYPVTLIAVLLLIATLIHLDRFDLDSLFGWFWVIVYAIVPPAFALLLVEQLRVSGDDPRGAPQPIAVRAALTVEGAVMVAIGGLMFLAPDPAIDVWPWVLTPLTSRAIGAFVIGIGVTALIAARDDDRETFRRPALAYALVGGLALLALLLHTGDLGGDGLATAIYVGFLAAILVTGLYGWSAASASSRS
jgi:hypothetical protein